MYPPWKPEIAEHNERVWETFLENLKTVIERAGGKFELVN